MTPARQYAKGIGDAVADRTINRVKPNGIREDWEDVAKRVALGNASLVPESGDNEAFFEFNKLHHHLRQASVLMSGRHLQHGDETQPTRNQEVFTNCLDGSTRVLTLEHGPVEIEKIAGTTVNVIARDGVPRPARINAHGEQELYEITFRSALSGAGNFRRTVRATEHHRWFLRDGSVTDYLREGDVIAAINPERGFDPRAVVHGIVFGDGSSHKRRADHKNVINSQGRTYATIRVCKQDAVEREICEWLDDAGYKFTTPPHANGDRVYYIGKFEHVKDLPHTTDPEYIAGFIYGWWLADGSKGVAHALEISTANELAAAWIDEYAGYAGFNLTMSRVMERREGDGSFVNGKALHCFRLRKNMEWKVESIVPVGRETVYCPEEPVTTGFVLANGLLTGNCSTAAATFLSFYLLLNGSGVGRSYDDLMIVSDLGKMPIVVPVIDMSHADARGGEINVSDLRTAKHIYADRTVRVFEVPDSREGWAKALEHMEVAAFEGNRRDEVLIIDFSKVRPRNSPIAGMQNRPASGPGPLIAAIKNIASLRDAGMAPWRAAMYADHWAAECVLVGGARRAARMATKFWKDKSVLDFIAVKRGGFLWSSNNSVTVDQAFWDGVQATQAVLDTFSSTDPKLQEQFLRTFQKQGGLSDLEIHAHKVFTAICEAAYFDQTGEPGLINVDMLTWSDEGTSVLDDGNYAESQRYKLDPETLLLNQALVKAWKNSEYKVITNPCGEIVLGSLGGYCVIADVVPYHSQNDDDAEDAFRTATRALIRTNLMDSLYSKEVARTNRIGVGMTGIHEYAWARFGFGWKDLVNEQASLPFWQMLARFSNACVDEAGIYSEKLGVVMPHTVTTIKPAGTTSKLFGLTEGAHLPSMREYLRWVQFRNDDPLIEDYKRKGYPIRKLQSYSGTTIVGFPTAPTICKLGMGDKLVTAAEATPEEQYEYLRLMEKYWLHGFTKRDGGSSSHEYANQVSYTLKINPKVIDFERFKKTLMEGQSTIKCCSVMPQVDTTSYEYQPEQPVSKHEFEVMLAAIKDEFTKEDIGLEHVDCAGGACPVDFKQ